MKIIIDTNLLVKHKLTPTEFVVLKQLESGVNQFSTDRSKLEEEGWIEGNKVTTKFTKTFNLSCDEWIEEWKNLFPKGIKTGGLPVRSAVSGCKVKMNKFIKEYDYTVDEIFQATKQYIEQKERERYSYMKTAVYFIEKDKQSTLAAYCDELGEKEELNEAGYDL